MPRDDDERRADLSLFFFPLLCTYIILYNQIGQQPNVFFLFKEEEGWAARAGLESRLERVIEEEGERKKEEKPDDGWNKVDFFFSRPFSLGWVIYLRGSLYIKGRAIRNWRDAKHTLSSSGSAFVSFKYIDLSFSLSLPRINLHQQQ